MDARERWQALQARLKSARAAFDAGDRATALEQVTAALALDGEFLAAHALRDRILAMAASPHPAPAHPAPLHLAPLGSDAPPGGYAQFEQRARRRRVDRKIDAARAALEQQRLKAAALALDEVIELDPNLPELMELTAQFDALRRSAATPRHGARLVAAAVFAIALFGGSWLQDSSPIAARQVVSAAPLPSLAPSVAAGRLDSAIDTVGTTGTRETAVEPAVTVEPAATIAAEPRAGVPAVPQTAVRPLAGASIEPPPPARLADALSDTPDSAAIVPVSTTISSRPEMREDDVLIKQTLQRYRSAYQGLDAQLIFDACDVRQYGESATATCHGSARYVPKVGSREPRVEPRVWNFTLRKAGADWKIDSARAER